jgi:hypothetical protein
MKRTAQATQVEEPRACLATALHHAARVTAAVVEGDANTLFHIHAKVWHRCKFIHSLEHDGRTLSSEASKKEALFSFFDKILGVS